MCVNSQLEPIAEGTTIADLVSSGAREPKHEEEANEWATNGNYIVLKKINAAVVKPPKPPPLQITEPIARLLARYIPGAARRTLDEGGEGDIAELHNVSVLFINCHGIELSASSDGDTSKVGEFVSCIVGAGLGMCDPCCFKSRTGQRTSCGGLCSTESPPYLGLVSLGGADRQRAHV